MTSRTHLHTALLLLVTLSFLATVTCCKSKTIEFSSAVPHKEQSSMEHSPTNFLVLYDSIVGKAPLMKAVEKVGAKVVYDYHFIHGMAICKSENMTLEETMAYFRKVKGVLNVEYDHIIRLTDPVRPKLESF